MQRRGLGGMAARADAEVEVGLGQAELAEEHVGHRRVVVLAGVDDAAASTPRARERA